MDKIGDTTVAKNMRDGWSAKTRYKLGDAPKGGQRILIIETSKRSNGGIESNASVHLDKGDGFLMHAFSLSRHGQGDYSTTAAKSQAKGTEKAIRALHAEALKGIDAIEAGAQSHYAARDNAQAINDRRDRELAEQDASDAALAVATERESAAAGHPKLSMEDQRIPHGFD